MHVKHLSHQQVLNMLPDRKADAHKGDFGKLLLLCGSRGYTGAAYFAAMGALRTGAGLVYLGVPESIYAIEAVKLSEPVVFPLPEENGMLSHGSLANIREYLPKMDAVLMGCGMGVSHGTLQVLQSVLQEFPGPVILDADGINLLAQHKDILRGRTGITVLTPHAGEFSRLGYSGDRLASAVTAAKELNCIILLKGHQTLITDGETVYQNQTGNPGMATGGSGDVLAGVIVSLIGQGLDPLEATAAAAWLHGKAGDLCAAEIGQYGMLPTDLLCALPRLMK
ncbi:MAG: NAD(P)H-hydrate dehydratase [Ruminococcaceae bacterium]|nr:NAD(P)H-hydrate dehydratase [Oscillospiraceae bacterium]